MKDTSLLNFEISNKCNLSACHHFCPVHLREKETGRSLTDELIVELAVEAYQKHGFTGKIAWHYYNEPMLQQNRLFRLMKQIKSIVPQAKFLLWTNATITPENEDMSLFSDVYYTNYDNNPDLDAYYKKYIESVHEVKVNWYDRLSVHKNNAANYDRCLRPLVEMIITSFGDVRLCCVDWRGNIKMGNVWDDPLWLILEQRRKIINSMINGMNENTPEWCLKCKNKQCGVITL